MKPKDKAKELINKMLNQQSHTEELYDAKQCALIAVDEVVNNFNYFLPNILYDEIGYWQEVKQEINKL